MAIIEATEATFEELVLKSEKPVVVDFWATWCTPCKMVAPEMEKLASKYEGTVDVVKVDVDANPAISQAFQIDEHPDHRVLPTRPATQGCGRLPATRATRAAVRPRRVRAPEAGVTAGRRTTLLQPPIPRRPGVLLLRGVPCPSPGAHTHHGSWFPYSRNTIDRGWGVWTLPDPTGSHHPRVDGPVVG